MGLGLNKPYASNAPVDDADTLMLKRALNRLGFYQPTPSVGMSDVPDTALFAAIRRFQTDQGLAATGTIRPGDATIATLARAVQFAGRNGPQQYVWRAVMDDHTRHAHAALNGTVRLWRDSPDPGEEPGCRCWAAPLPDPQTDAIRLVYPELMLLPLLRVPKLYSAWKAWVNRRDTTWTLGKFKSETRWGNQLKDRDWTPEQITDTLKYGTKYPAPNKVNPANPATRYEWEGRFVVRDEETNEILQLGMKNFVRLPLE